MVGSTNSVNSVPTTMPMTTTMPMAKRLAAPAPPAKISGTRPATIAAVVISTGRMRTAAARRIADAAPDLAAEVRSGSVPRTLPVDADFAVSGLRAGVAYQTAWSLWAFVAGRFGEGTLKKLYRTAAAGDASASTGAIASVLKIDPGDFVAQWRRWLVAETR